MSISGNGEGKSHTIKHTSRIAVKRRLLAAVSNCYYRCSQGQWKAFSTDQTGELAKQAYFELMNPKVVTDVKVPDDDKAKKKD